VPIVDIPEGHDMDIIRRWLARAWVRDTAERVAWTFVQGAVGAVPVQQLATGDIDALTSAAVGGAAAVLALVKAIAARKVGDPQTASTLRVWTAQQIPGQDDQ
jgi:hypothetical protein